MHHAPHKTERTTQHPGERSGFPHAPVDWSPSQAEDAADSEDLTLTPEHWEALRALQAYYASTDTPRTRELVDALDERFHTRGGLKFLYTLFPGGPVAQGCRLAGLAVPPGAQDNSFGSVQ